jgi:hypothetical protein
MEKADFLYPYIQFLEDLSGVRKEPRERSGSIQFAIALHRAIYTDDMTRFDGTPQTRVCLISRKTTSALFLRFVISSTARRVSNSCSPTPPRKDEKALPKIKVVIA